MRRTIKYLSILLLIICLTACGKGDNGGINLLPTKKLKASDLSISDFEWNTDASKCYGNDCYIFSLKNNSKYDIVGFQFKYSVKDDVPTSDLDIYDDFMKDHDGYIEEDDSPRYVTLNTGAVDVLLSQGESKEGTTLRIGYRDWTWYSYPNDKQFELMEPNELQVGIIYEKKLYLAYYSFLNKSWKLDAKTGVADEWTNKEIGKKLPKTNGKHFIVIVDEDDYYNIGVYGITKELYNEYIDELVKQNYEKGEYDRYKKDGYTIDLYYNEDMETLDLSIKKDN